ncbi:hypothetical protein Tfu_2098 [Thermobifida fusca YX]|uniref:Uncharacterized protein n=1 Tax=Thermobifida fusca (strain YX) TaxID=269800 RepID=Q47N38_THEFY|nr:hypothetical protein Tfu_2098 [Thermobifida fusca YX]
MGHPATGQPLRPRLSRGAPPLCARGYGVSSGRPSARSTGGPPLPRTRPPLADGSVRRTDGVAPRASTPRHIPRPCPAPRHAPTTPSLNCS